MPCARTEYAKSKNATAPIVDTVRKSFMAALKTETVPAFRLRNILTNTQAHAGVACTQPSSVVTRGAFLKCKLQGKLHDSRINNSSSSGIRSKKVNRVIQKISDRIGKLRVIEGVEEFGPKL
jgi:hypothetical protein